MKRINNLPIISGCLAALVAGVAGCALGMGNEAIYIRMVVIMAVFFVLGVYVRSNILSVKKEANKNTIKEAIKGMEEFKKQKEEELIKAQKKAKEIHNESVQKKSEDSDESDESAMENSIREDDGFRPLNANKLNNL